MILFCVGVGLGKKPWINKEKHRHYCCQIFLLGPDLARRLANGQCGQIEIPGSPGCVRLYDLNRRFLGLGELQSEGRLVSKRLVAVPLAEGAGDPRPKVASL